MPQLYSEMDQNGTIVKDRIRLVPGLKLQQGHRWIPYAEPVSSIKINKKIYINSKRNEETISPVTYLGKQWQTDRRSIELLSNTILLDYLGITPAPTIWRSLDNTNVEVNIQDLKNIAGLIATKTREAYTKSWDLKDSIESANTAEEVSAIIW